jgi:hypothetical protein
MTDPPGDDAGQGPPPIVDPVARFSDRSLIQAYPELPPVPILPIPPLQVPPHDCDDVDEDVDDDAAGQRP